MTNKGILSHTVRDRDRGEEGWREMEGDWGRESRGKHFESAAVGCIFCLTLQKIAFPLFQRNETKGAKRTKFSFRQFVCFLLASFML